MCTAHLYRIKRLKFPQNDTYSKSIDDYFFETNEFTYEENFKGLTVEISKLLGCELENMENKFKESENKYSWIRQEQSHEYPKEPSNIPNHILTNPYTQYSILCKGVVIMNRSINNTLSSLAQIPQTHTSLIVVS